MSGAQTKCCGSCKNFIPSEDVPSWGNCSELAERGGAFSRVCLDHGSGCRRWEIKLPRCASGRRLLNL